jgi:5-methylcytosine-specific restriction enzyme A
MNHSSDSRFQRFRQMWPKNQPRQHKTKPQPKPVRYTGASEEVLDLVRERCGGRCERCARSLAGGDLHHRIPRGMGGSRDLRLNRASAVVALCRHCHTHVEHYRLSGMRDGWLLTRIEDPRIEPIRSALHGRVLLADDGTITQFEGGAP